MKLPLAALTIAAMAAPALCADYTVREITKELFAAKVGETVDLSGKDLSRLDLSGTNFKAARLSRSNLFGADLTDADLSGALLQGTTLDRTTLVRTKFDHADLSDATLLIPATYVAEMSAPGDAPSFRAATLKRLRMTGLYRSVSFRSADLTEADLSSPTKNFGDHSNANTKRTTCQSCDYQGARLVGADLTHTLMQFSSFAGADFTGADLSYADFTKADLSGANLTGAKLVGTNFSSANLQGVIGIEIAR